MVLFGMQNRTFGPYLAAINSILTSPGAPEHQTTHYIASALGSVERCRFFITETNRICGPIWHTAQDIWSQFSSHT
jgi:hypothetical protein